MARFLLFLEDDSQETSLLAFVLDGDVSIVVDGATGEEQEVTMAFAVLAGVMVTLLEREMV